MSTRLYKLKVSFSKFLDSYWGGVKVYDPGGAVLQTANETVVQDAFNMWCRLYTDLLVNSGCTFQQVSYTVRSALGRAKGSLHYFAVLKCVASLDDRLILDRTSTKLSRQDLGDEKVSWLAGMLHRDIFFKLPLEAKHQLFTFLKRITLRDRDDLMETTRDAYLSNMRRLIELPEVDNSECSVEATLIERVCSGYCAPLLSECGFSPGSTADSSIRRCRSFKYWINRIDAKTRYFCIQNNLYKGCDSMPLTEQVPPEDVLFVPKSWKTYRSVKMEYEFRNFFQNGIVHQLRKCIAMTIPDHINFRDQDTSRRLARWGSETGRLACHR